jgi:hypothetical protein
LEVLEVTGNINIVFVFVEKVVELVDGQFVCAENAEQLLDRTNPWKDEQVNEDAAKQLKPSKYI